MWRQLLELDREKDAFRDQLCELKITFPPSYPFEESLNGTTYGRTRCPAWCDRILMSKSAVRLFHKVSETRVYKLLAPRNSHVTLT